MDLEPDLLRVRQGLSMGRLPLIVSLSRHSSKKTIEVVQKIIVISDLDNMPKSTIPDIICYEELLKEQDEDDGKCEDWLDKFQSKIQRNSNPYGAKLGVVQRCKKGDAYSKAILLTNCINNIYGPV